MDSSCCILQLLLLFLFFFSSFCNARIIFPIYLDAYTNQFTMQMNIGSPRENYSLVIDLGGNVTWLPCTNLYASSSRRRISRMSSKCSRVSQPPPCVSCNRTTPCSISLSNPVSRSINKGELFSDVMSFLTISEAGFYLIRDPNPRRFTFGCANGTPESLLDGVAGLGRSSVLSLVFQFSASFRFSRIFALYLATPLRDDDDEEYTGSLYFGGGPYDGNYFDFAHPTSTDEDPTSSPKEMIYSGTTYARLLINPKSREDYYIDLRFINIVGDYANGTYGYVNEVPIDHKRLLSINKITGVGGTKISITSPYTTMQTSVYKAVTEAYIDKARASNISMVPPVAPFSACFRDEDVENLPYISFVLSSKEWGNLNWVLSYFYALKHFPVERGYVNDGDVSCLALVDGGLKPMASIVIGLHQLKDRFVEFDIPRSQVAIY